jgi:hypothetical protein
MEKRDGEGSLADGDGDCGKELPNPEELVCLNEILRADVYEMPADTILG